MNYPYNKKYKLAVILESDISETETILDPSRDTTSLFLVILNLYPSVFALDRPKVFKLLDIEDNNYFWNNYTKKNVENLIEKVYEIYDKPSSSKGHINYGYKVHDEIKRCYSPEMNNTSNLETILIKDTSISNDLRQDNFSKIEKLLEENDKDPDAELYFIRPIRNPCDIVLSYMSQSSQSTRDVTRNYSELLEWCMNDLIWFLRLEEKYPSKFYHFFAPNFDSREVLNFMKIEIDEDKCSMVNKVYGMGRNVIKRANEYQKYKLKEFIWRRTKESDFVKKILRQLIDVFRL